MSSNAWARLFRRAACGGIAAAVLAGAPVSSAAADDTAKPATSPAASDPGKPATGPKLDMVGLPGGVDAKPGDVIVPRIYVGNTGDAPADKAIITFRGSPQLAFAQSHSGCYYRTDDLKDPVHPNVSSTVCVLDGPFEPGAYYGFGDQMRVVANKDAFIEDLEIHVAQEPYSEALLTTMLTKEPFTYTPGTGSAIHAVKEPSKPAPGEHPDWLGVFRIHVANTADFGLTGSTVRGGVGQTVTVKIISHNFGPAAVTDSWNETPAGAVDVTIPEGTEFAGSLDLFQALAPNGTPLPGRNHYGARRYRTSTSYTNPVGHDYPVHVELKITKVVPNATGRAFYTKDRWPMSYDENPANDATTFVINPKTGSATTGGTTTGGSTGGDGGTGHPATGTTGTTGSTGTTGAAPAPSPSPSTTPAVAPPTGDLAHTGSDGMGLIATSAALALALGGGLFLFIRRRNNA